MAKSGRNPGKHAPPTHIEPAKRHNTFELEPKTLSEMLGIPGEQLHQVDIAQMNLLCVAGLPGASRNVPHVPNPTTSHDLPPAHR